MLRHTWDRARRLVPAERIVTVITAGQERWLRSEPATPGHVLVQPCNRETGAGLLYPLLWIAARDPGANIAVFPADHFIWEESRFLGAVAECVTLGTIWPDRLVVLGIPATSPDTNYGWIEPGPAIAGALPGRIASQVARFWEKPRLAFSRLLYGADCLWNSFVLSGTLPAFLDLAHRHRPDVLETLQAALTDPSSGSLDAAYRRLAPMDATRDLLERGAERLIAYRAEGILWSDWGRPEHIVETLVRIHRRPAWLHRFPHLAAAQG